MHRHDEDVDDLEALESGADTGADLSDPEWWRSGVRGPTALGAPQLGDPTRWGANISFPVNGTIAGTQVFRSGQIISAMTRDGYSRPWGISGTLTYPALFGALPDNLAGATGFIVALSVTMGVGQTQIVHNINVRSTIAADAPYYHPSDQTMGGLLGPYTIAEPGIFPFVVPTSLVGSMISIQLLMAFTATPAVGVNFDIGGAILITPFAAGQNL